MRLVPYGSETYGKYYALKGNRPVGIVHRRYLGGKDPANYRWYYKPCDSLKAETIFPSDATYYSVIKELNRWT